MTAPAPDLAHIEAIALATVEALPDVFRYLARSVAIRVTDWPEDWMLQEVGLTRPLELTGMYDGIPLTEKSFFDQPHAPDAIWLFREPILAELRERDSVSLEELVAHVTIHEFAHHFGWSDDDIAAIDRWWE